MITLAQQTVIKALQHQGFGPSAIAARLGLDRKTVRKVPRAGRVLPAASAPTRPPTVDTRSLSHGDSTMAGGGCPDVLQATPHGPTPRRAPPHRVSGLCRSYALVQRTVNRRRTPAPPTGTPARIWHAGECPGDCGTAEAVWDGIPQTGQDLTVRVPYSHVGYLPGGHRPPTRGRHDASERGNRRHRASRSSIEFKTTPT